jgi:hypothetical protein
MAGHRLVQQQALLDIPDARSNRMDDRNPEVVFENVDVREAPRRRAQPTPPGCVSRW